VTFLQVALMLGYEIITWIILSDWRTLMLDAYIRLITGTSVGWSINTDLKSLWLRMAGFIILLLFTITFSTVPRKFRLLAILWCTYNTDNKLLRYSVSTSNNFCICDSGKSFDNLLVSSMIISNSDKLLECLSQFHCSHTNATPSGRGI